MEELSTHPSTPSTNSPTSRRDFLEASSTLAMGGGLVAGYGVLAVMAGRYLYPMPRTDLIWQFVGVLKEFQLGESREFIAPNGAKVVIARQGEGDSADNFVALSSVCPHLGCQVHWEPQNNRFFCPCHNGAFDPQGRATEGPPAKAGQSLTEFPLRVEDGLLYIQAPVTNVVSQPADT